MSENFQFSGNLEINPFVPEGMASRTQMVRFGIWGGKLLLFSGETAHGIS